MVDFSQAANDAFTDDSRLFRLIFARERVGRCRDQNSPKVEVRDVSDGMVFEAISKSRVGDVDLFGDDQ